MKTAKVKAKEKHGQFVTMIKGHLASIRRHKDDTGELRPRLRRIAICCSIPDDVLKFGRMVRDAGLKPALYTGDATITSKKTKMMYFEDPDKY